VRNPNNLKIKRVSRSDNLYAPWLPAAEEEPCPNEGKSGKTNKRISLERPTGVFDSFEAGKQAKSQWVQELQRAQKSNKAQAGQHLGVYCDNRFSRECSTRETHRNFARWKRDEKLKREGDSYGIKHQPWAHKSVEDITARDFQNYWRILEYQKNRQQRHRRHYGTAEDLTRKLLK